MPEGTRAGDGEQHSLPRAATPQELVLEHSKVPARQIVRFVHRWSNLLEQQVNGPTASDMDSAAATMVQELRVGAASVLQRVGQDWEPVEGTLVVDRPRDPGNRPVVPGEIE